MAVKIILTCGYCGGREWMPLKDGMFQCINCGTEAFPEVMCAEVMEEENK